MKYSWWQKIINYADIDLQIESLEWLFAQKRI